MLKILFASHNPGKLKRYQNLFSEFKDLELLSLSDLNISAKVEEPFLSSIENARYKAKEYACLSSLPSIAVDEALSTNFLPDNEQPGVFVRRFNEDKKDLSDIEILATWFKIFQEYSHPRATFIWDFSLAYYDPRYNIAKEAQAQQIDFVQLDFSSKIDPGYPMSSFLKPQGYEKTYVDLSPEEFLAVDRKNLKSFTDLMSSVFPSSNQ